MTKGGVYDKVLDVLDKIKAEVEQYQRKTQGIDPYDLVGDCLDIIDEHRAESEAKGCR